MSYSKPHDLIKSQSTLIEISRMFEQIQIPGHHGPDGLTCINHHIGHC